MNQFNNSRGPTSVPGIKDDKGRSCLIVLILLGAAAYFLFQDFDPNSIGNFFEDRLDEVVEQFEDDYEYEDYTPEIDYEVDETPERIRVPEYEPAPVVIEEPGFTFDINGETVDKLSPSICREILKQRVEIKKQLEADGVEGEILDLFLAEFDAQLDNC